MTQDIVERARKIAESHDGLGIVSELADEITKLRAERDEALATLRTLHQMLALEAGPDPEVVVADFHTRIRDMLEVVETAQAWLVAPTVNGGEAMTRLSVAVAKLNARGE